ncbi:hypothetical protein AB0M87_16955 [Streptomyces sp. NPDC051320]|uniref:hypothetical protein n=1 Tax=Streptomyces sp. NPDC051320 TaxID=3154644 RepID=UPI00343B9B14
MASRGAAAVTSLSAFLTERAQQVSTGLLVDGDIDHPDTKPALADATVTCSSGPARA